MYELFGRPRWRPVLTEAQLVWYRMPYTLNELDDLFASAAARQRLALAADAEPRLSAVWRRNYPAAA